MISKSVIIIFLFFLSIQHLTYAETNGTLNFSIINLSVTSGIFGHTVSTCSIDNDCFQYKCFLDFDGISEGSAAGWCNETAITNCYANVSSTSGTSKVYTTSSSVCVSSTAYRTCSSGSWGNATACSSNQTCSSGSCSASSSSSSSSGGGGSSSSNTTTTTTTIKTPAVSIILVPEAFNITQGNTTVKNIIVKNTGDLKLSNIVLTVTGLENWSIVEPLNLSTLDKNITQTFTITIKIPSKAEVDIYKATINIATNYSSATATGSFFINVVPSEETVENEIVPRFNDYTLQLDRYRRNLTEFEKQGVNIDELVILFNNAEEILDKASRELQSGNYFDAKIFLDEAESLLNAITIKMLEKQADKPSSLVIIIIIVALIAVGAVVGYMLYPSKPKESGTVFIKFK